MTARAHSDNSQAWRTALQFHTFQHSTAFASFWDPLTSLAASPPTWHHVQPVDGTLGGPIMTRASHGVEPYTEVLTLFFPEDLSAVGKNKVRSVCGFPMIGGLGVEGERALLGTNRGWWDDGQVTSDAEAGQGEERKELGRGKGGKAKRKPAKDADAGKGELTEWKGEKVRAFVYVFSWRSAEKERVFKETETWWSVARGEMRPILEVFFEEFEAAGLLGWESLHGYF